MELEREEDLIANLGRVVYRYRWFSPLGFVDATLPNLMFCTVFGVSMDYEVFLLSRIREAYEHGESNTASVARGLVSTAGIITSAAAIIINRIGLRYHRRCLSLIHSGSRLLKLPCTLCLICCSHIRRKDYGEVSTK